MTARPILFLSDYGYDDEFAGVCRAVIARIAPDVPIIDIAHGLPRHGVRQAAVVLANSAPFTPAGIHLAVVDPGVGSDRRPVAIRCRDEDRLLVGPDNGVLAPALELLGGAIEAVDLTHSPFRLEPVSATFHGRDIFAPVAARLAAGTELSEVGEAVASDSLAALPLPEPDVGPERVVAHVLYVDRFGNATLDLRHEHLADGPLRLGEPVQVETGGGRFDVDFARTFSDVEAGEGLLYEDSHRALALAVNRGSAAETMRIAPDDEVVLTPAP